MNSQTREEQLQALIETKLPEYRLKTIKSFIPYTWGMIGDHWEVILTKKSEGIDEQFIIYTRKKGLVFEYISSVLRPDTPSGEISTDLAEINSVKTEPSATFKLRQEQLYLLCNIVYLDELLKHKNKKFIDIVSDIIREIDKIEQFPCLMTKVDWLNILHLMKKDEKLKDLVFECYQEITEDSPDVYAGQRIACFTVSEGGKLAAYVIFRGTYGEKEWLDNAHGMVQADTLQQRAALKYVESINEKLRPQYLAVAGHSKGGNKAQYVGLVAPDGMVDYCLSVDGQGFSAAFMKKYQYSIESRSYIHLIAEHRDFVNCLGLYIHSNPKCASLPTKFYRGWRGICFPMGIEWTGDPLPYFHIPDALVTALYHPKADIPLELGFLHNSGPGLIPSLVNDLISDFLTNDKFTQEQRKQLAEYACSLAGESKGDRDWKMPIGILILEVSHMLCRNDEFTQKVENMMRLEYNAMSFNLFKCAEFNNDFFEITVIIEDFIEMLKTIKVSLAEVVIALIEIYKIFIRFFLWVSEDLIIRVYLATKIWQVFAFVVVNFIATYYILAGLGIVPEIRKSMKAFIKDYINCLTEQLEKIEDKKETYNEVKKLIKLLEDLMEDCSGIEQQIALVMKQRS